MIGCATASEVSYSHPNAGYDEHERNKRGIKRGNLCYDRSDVGVDGKEAAKSHCANEQGEPNLQFRECCKFTTQGRRSITCLLWESQENCDEGSGEQQRNYQVRRAPTRVLPNQGDGWHADDVRNG